MKIFKTKKDKIPDKSELNTVLLALSIQKATSKKRIDDFIEKTFKKLMKEVKK